MKVIPQAQDLIKFVKTAEFYNKIQVTSEGKTETLWYLRDDQKWMLGNEDGSGADIAEEAVLSKLQNLNDDSNVVIAGNDTAGVLKYNF